MSGPLVSVVIPTRNRPQYLREALASVCRQTYPHLEIIVHDNASDYDVDGLLRSLADPRIALYRNDQNVGSAANYLAGCRRAAGKYIAALGDDDRWHPDFVASLVAPLEADEDLVLAFCDHEVIDTEGRRDPAASERTSRRWRRHRLHEGVHRPFDELALVDRAICLSATLFRRDVLDYSEVPAKAGAALDLYLFYLAARTGRGCYYTPRRLAEYRYQPASLTGRIGTLDGRRKAADHAVFYWGKFLDDPALQRHRRYFEMKRGYNALLVVTDLLRRGRAGEARRRLAHFVRTRVITPRIFFYHLVYAVRERRLAG
jgi:glycosyltransferase involved in cell wall biosynthesis